MRLSENRQPAAGKPFLSISTRIFVKQVHDSPQVIGKAGSNWFSLATTSILG